VTTALQAVLGTALVTELGSSAKAQGFRRARRVWRKSNEHGDWAAFDVQSSQWNTGGSIDCVVNVGAAPAPWLDFQTEAHGLATRNFGPADGLFQSRLGPRDAGTDDSWWRIETEAEARSVAQEIAERMTSEGFPLIDELLDRTQMLERVRAGEMGFAADPNPYWLAVVLADNGPSRELDQALQQATHNLDPEERAELRSWCSDRSAATKNKVPRTTASALGPSTQREATATSLE
jgi:hypothetical protein